MFPDVLRNVRAVRDVRHGVLDRESKAEVGKDLLDGLGLWRQGARVDRRARLARRRRVRGCGRYRVGAGREIDGRCGEDTAVVY